MFYRKKPVIIQALQFKDDSDGLAAMSDFLGQDTMSIDYYDPVNPKLLISTLEGDMAGNVGDYIIKGVKGEFYPCREDIFNETYEKA